MTSGIYKIENKKTGQIYIGQSVNVERRMRLHCYISPLDRDIFLQGEDAFDFSIVEEVPENKLREREIYWINQYGTYTDNNHYNLSIGGYGKQRYTLWNVHTCGYESYNMKRANNPCKCFRVIYNGKRVPIGMFHDFYSCQMINNLIEDFTKEEDN